MQFEYIVLDLKKKRTKGVIEATSLNHARNLLKDRKTFIIDLKQKKSFYNINEKINKRRKAKLSFGSLVDFTRQMGIMINAGLSLVDALNIILDQTKDISQKLVVTKIDSYVKSGSALSTAMKDMPDSFPGYYISLIKAGESSGKLDDVFLRLAENLEKAREFRGKIMGALIYPIVLF